MSPDPSDALPPDQQAMLEAANATLLPLARLAVARGVHFGVIEERLKQAFVQAAREANPGSQPHRQVSRVSATTGINRREVTRLIHGQLQQARPRRPVAAEIYLHWQIDPDYRDALGQPATLVRQGPKPSFETLAREITSDVHPRSLLDDMVRLGYCRLVDDSARVAFVRDAAVPATDLPRLIRVLGDNVGAHFMAAVENALSDDKPFFERALVAHEVPESAVPEVKRLVAEHWAEFRGRVVPALERLIEQGAQGDEPLRRLLLGIYHHDAPESPSPSTSTTPLAGPPDPAA
ncbi:MAG: hypothetical protein J0M20_09250 [Burkholderiales bacterium]|nr:hypothetical protein [Burkholderiales bacterium]